MKSLDEKLEQARNLAEKYRDLYCAAASHVYANSEDLTETERVAYKAALLVKFCLPWEDNQ